MKIVLLLFVVFSSLAFDRTYDLEFLGYKDGFIANYLDKYDANFKVPDRSIVEDVKINLHIKYSSLLQEGAYIVVLVNDNPISTIDLSKGRNTYAYNVFKNSITVPRRLLRSNNLKVTFKNKAVLSGDECSDRNNANSLIHVLPTTSLEVRLRKAPQTIADYFLTLPKNVNIYHHENFESLNKLDALFDLIFILNKSGREITYTENFRNSHIAFGDLSYLDNQINTLDLDSKEDLIDVKSQKQISIVRRGEVQKMFVGSTFEGQVDKLLSDYLEINQSSSTTSHLTKVEGQQNSFYSRDDLGMSNKGVVSSSGVEWSFKLKPASLKGSNIPKSLFVSLVTSPSKSDFPHQLYVYQNSQLLKVVDLENSGRPQGYLIGLNHLSQNQDLDIRMKVAFSQRKGSCLGDDHFYNEVGLLGDSYLEFADLSEEVGLENGLSSLSYLFNKKIKVVFPSSLKGKLVILKTLSTIVRSYGISPSNLTFVSDEGLSDINENDAFIVFSETKTIDKLSTLLSSSEIHRLLLKNKFADLAVSDLKSLMVIQKAKLGKSYGINVHYPHGVMRGTPSYINFDKNDILFVSKDRVIKGLDTQSPEISALKISKESDFLSFLKSYKYLVFVLIWLLITYLFIRISKKR